MNSARIGAAVLVTAALTLPAAGWAKGGNSVKVKSPHKTKIGNTVNYTVSGTSASTGNTLHVFLNAGHKCPKTYNKEHKLPAQIVTEQPSESPPKGKFSFKKQVFADSLGKHYICAYLVTTKNKTLAKGSSKYVTKPPF